MSGLAFHKMHGLGNDFVVVDARAAPVDLGAWQISAIGDRRRGVGFDQLVLIETDKAADARLRFFNPDGGEAGACGNGTRCAARLLLGEGGPRTLRLATAGGTLTASATDDGAYTVAMAEPRFEWTDIPLAHACNTLYVPLALGVLPPPVAVSMGNPHAVFFVHGLDQLDVAELGAFVQKQPMFPQGVNVGFAEVRGPDRIRLRVFERGAGLTQACGSGACACFVAAVRRGLLSGRATVEVDGGELEIAWGGSGPVQMTGPAAHVCAGTLDPELWAA